MLARALFKSVARRMAPKAAKNTTINIARRYTTHKVNSAVGFGRSAILAGIGAGALGVGAYLFAPRSFAEDKIKQELTKTDEEEQENALFERAGSFRADLPVYSREDISKHNTMETRIWVTYKEGVYDITDFIEMHPGRDKILMAAGRAIDPFWTMYQQHRTDQVAEMLEEYRIGNLNKEDAAKIQSEMTSDPYVFEPTRNPQLLRRSMKPYNAETPGELLTQNLVTPNDLFYIRNHLPVPHIEESKYALTISSESLDKPITLTLEDLRKKFKQHSVMAAIQCAGNRRDDFNKLKEVKGLTWDVGAIGNAVWSGPKLRDILIWAGVDPESADLMHVHFEGLDKDFEKNYAASIPIDKAMSPHGDVILALEMNGEAIPIDHGYPVRAVVPGVVGARNVKWLGKVHVSKTESQGHWQQLDYKGFNPDANWNKLDFNSAPAIQDMPVQSAITHIKPETDIISIKGYAWSGGGRGIVRVDVSTDGGKTWQVAELEKPDQRPGRVWGWTLWKLNVPVEQVKDRDQLLLLAKAIDESYNVQPDGTAGLWNLRGVLNNAWHKREVKINAK